MTTRIRHDVAFAATPLLDADASGGDPVRGEGMARALLASVTDERYAFLAEPCGDPRRPWQVAGRSPFPLQGAVVKYDAQP